MRRSSLTLLLLPLLALPAAAGAIGVSAVATVTQAAASDAAARSAKEAKANKAARPAAVKPVRAPAVVASTGAGQTGYVHYWLITAPDGTQEMQVGMELPDQRIVWSFPGVGVTVAPFIAAGEYDARGRVFKVQHQYGLRPYRNDPAVHRLQAGLQQRLKYWIDNATPYCELNGVHSEVCVSCFGFVAQILYPGKSRMYADFPRDFPRTGGEDFHTTEDLLLYLAGMHALPNAAVRQQRMNQLGGPPALREELTRLSALVVDAQPTAVASAPRRRNGARVPARSVGRAAVRPG